MTAPFPGFERPAEVQDRPPGRVVRVQPDITALDERFDYVVPPAWDSAERAEDVGVGSMVRIELNGRRTAGWVVEVDVEPDPAIRLQPLARWSGHGPPAELIDLADWAAWRWAGRSVHFLRAASPPRMVPDLPGSARASGEPPEPPFLPGVTVVRSPPTDPGVELAAAAARTGRALVIVPTVAQRRHLVRELRARGVAVAEYDEQWARSAAGYTTIGTRRAALAPIGDLTAVVVIDEHDSAHKEERTPSWNARDVAIERARRAGAPCVLTSASPSLEALEVADRQLAPERSSERTSWPVVDVVDLREQDRPGLLTEHLVPIVRGAGPIACILNRKGRARMLACTTCDSLAACTECGAALREVRDGDRVELVCPRDGTARPVVCAECGGTRMKQLRVGISTMAEELAALARRDVVEVDADTAERDLTGDRLFVGTEALLRRIPTARAVVFLDFDQELGVHRYRAAHDAFAALALAARRVGTRADGGRLVIQTRRPADVVVQAALHGDPGRVARAQREVRRVFDQPPYGAWALVSGAGADDFVASLPSADVTCLERDGRWRIAASDHRTLLDALAAGERGSERVRVEVDPLDA